MEYTSLTANPSTGSTFDASTDGWHCKTWKGLPYFTCSLLSAWPHGFFTLPFWPQSPEELVNILQPDARVYRVKQVHGNIVLTASEIAAAFPPLLKGGLGGDLPFSSFDGSEPEGDLPLADGLLTEQARQSVWVCSADCTPVLIADTQTGQVAAVHAGWRGTEARIVPEAIARLLSQGSQLPNLLVAMGPAIAGEVYQLTIPVAAQIGASIIPQSDADSPEIILDALWQLPNSPLLPDSQPGRVRMDIRRVNAIQLEQLGLDSAQVAIAQMCTYQQPDLFFSYRRNKLKKVQWSGIVSQ